MNSLTKLPWDTVFHALKGSELCYSIHNVEYLQKLLLNAGIKETNMSMPFKHIFS